MPSGENTRLMVTTENLHSQQPIRGPGHGAPERDTCRDDWWCCWGLQRWDSGVYNWQDQLMSEWVSCRVTDALLRSVRHGNLYPPPLIRVWTNDTARRDIEPSLSVINPWAGKQVCKTAIALNFSFQKKFRFLPDQVGKDIEQFVTLTFVSGFRYCELREL